MSDIRTAMLPRSIEFTVLGILPGWQRAGKNGKRHYTQRQTEQAEIEVAAWGRQAMNGMDLLRGPLGMRVDVVSPLPASWSDKRKVKAMEDMLRPDVKPDWDNLGKLVSDALNGVVYSDDKSIADARVVKWYGRFACTVVKVWELGGSDLADAPLILGDGAWGVVLGYRERVVCEYRTELVKVGQG